jgi:hypothetical protein
VTSAAESTTGVNTKSAASRIKTVLMDQVRTDVRRVVGRENRSSQGTSLLLLVACGDCGAQWFASFWAVGGVDSFSLASEGEEEGGGGLERRGATGMVAV